MNFSEKEEWAPVPGFEGLYDVSSFGEVRSLILWRGTKSRILVKTINKKGYCQTRLNKNGKKYTFCTHQLVGIVFVPNPLQKGQINHMDGVKTNNKSGNLEWSTPKENTQHSISVLNNKHGSACCKKIKNIETGDIYPSIKSAAKAIGRCLSYVTIRLTGKVENDTALLYYKEA